MDESEGKKILRSLLPFRPNMMFGVPQSFHSYRSYIEKRFLCPMYECRKRYSDPSSLRKHLKGLHGESAYAVFSELKNSARFWERNFRILNDIDGNAHIVGINGERVDFDAIINHVNDMTFAEISSQHSHFPMYSTPSFEQFLFPPPFGVAPKSEPPSLNSTPTLNRRSTMNVFEPGSSANRESSPNTAQNNGPVDTVEQKARREEEQEKYETFLCDEVLKRPHLLKKIVSTNMEA